MPAPLFGGSDELPSDAAAARSASDDDSEQFPAFPGFKRNLARYVGPSEQRASGSLRDEDRVIGTAPEQRPPATHGLDTGRVAEFRCEPRKRGRVNCARRTDERCLPFQCGAARAITASSGGSIQEWYGAGEGSSHSSPCAPSQGFAGARSPPITQRMMMYSKMN